MKKNYGPPGFRGVARGVARISVKAPVTKKIPRPHRPYVRQPKLPAAPSPVTHVPTTSSTGVTTATGTMPGAPSTSDMPDVYAVPKIKNWKKASAAEIAQAMLAPQYASLTAQHHQSQLDAQQQQAAIQSYGLDLAKILGTAGPGGKLPTLGPNYAAALSMDALRHFTYNQAVESAKYADEFAKVAAQYPTYLNQILAQKADEKRKDAAFALQQLVAQQTYGLNVAKTKSYLGRANALTAQGNARIKQAQTTLKLNIAKYNKTVADDAGKIDWRGSIIAGKAVNAAGQTLNVPISNNRFKAARSGSTGSKGSKSNPISISDSKQVGHWVYKDLTPVPPRIVKARGLGVVPSRYKPSGGGPGGPKLPPGYSRTQYRRDYGKASSAARNMKADGLKYKEYIQSAIENGIPRWVARKAAKKYYPKAY